MTDYLNPNRIYPDCPSRRIDNPPGNDSIRPGRDDSHPPGAGGGRMTAIRAISYTESRLEHFKAVREKRKKTLHWWKYQKPDKQYDQQTIWEMCSEVGREISYLDDVIAMLEKLEVEG